MTIRYFRRRLYRPQPTSQGGFTLIELLVVILIVGILAGISIPAYLNQANRARQAEALIYVGAMIRGQQVYRLENTTFATAIEDLGLGLPAETQFYQYGNGTVPSQVDPIPGGAISNSAMIIAAPKDASLLGYTGIVFTQQDPQGNSTTSSRLCVGDTPGLAPTVAIEDPGLDTVTIIAANATFEDCLSTQPPTDDPDE